MSNRWCYDVELFPNFFCCSFINIKTQEKKVFIIWEKQNDIKRLKEFLKEDLFLVGFNSNSYDFPIIRFILSYKGNSLNKDLFNISKKLISDYFRDDEEVLILRYPREKEYNLVHQDLMAMSNFVRLGVGLKQISINLRWHRVQDLPLEYTHIVRDEDIATIVDYNINDVLITLALYNDKTITQARELRENLAEEYDNRMLSTSDSKIANLIKEDEYKKATGIHRKEFKELRTFRDTIKLSDVIFPNIEFKTKQLSDLLNKFKKIKVNSSNKFKFEDKLSFYGNTFQMGVGGLHSNEQGVVYRATENKKIMTVDVASYYPSLLTEYKIKPEHLTDDFTKILATKKKERIIAKRSGDKTKAESFKIVLNSTFGKTGFENHWLYDPLVMLKTTLNGQLFLLMLIESFELNGIKVISSNTDGVEVEITSEQEELAMQIAKKWQEKTHFELEFDYYDIYYKRDVNNYGARNTHGKIKTKGAFLDEVDLKKQNRHLIIAKAVNQYFLNGTPVEETIMSCNDVFSFCLSQKIGKQFDMEQVRLSGVDTSNIPTYSKQMMIRFLDSIGKSYLGESVVELESIFKQEWISRELGQRKLEKIELQKTNRFFISNKGAVLQKRNKNTQGTIGLMVGLPVTILNDYDPNIPFEQYDINFKWYIKQAKDMIEEIEPTIIQLDMFGNATMIATTTSLSQETSAKLSETKKPKKPKDILEADKTKKKFPVSRSFMLVTGISTTEAGVKNITVYNLASGREAKLKMNKVLFGGKSVDVGNLLEITRFSKK